MSEQYNDFDAFISYRHTERDKKVVDRLQKLTENFRSPCDGTHIRKGERIRRIFTDRSELPLCADLGSSITKALESSRFLVVIASPEYTQSRWCMEELKTFLMLHEYSTDHILFVQVDGSPSCITEILRAAGVSVEGESFREPLYINACASNTRERMRIINKEYMRLAAVLIGCGYDALYGRHRREKRRRMFLSAALFLLIGGIISVFFAIQARQKQRQTDYRNMDAAIGSIHALLREEDRVDALKAMRELYDRYGQKEAYGDYLAEQMEPAAIRAGYVPAFSAFARESVPFEQFGISTSSDGKYVIVYDIASTREEGEMKLSLYDPYLMKLSEHTLPVEEWKDQLVMGSIFHSLTIDYYHEEGTFLIELPSEEYGETPGTELVFSREGQLLSSQELTAEEWGQSPLEVRELYRQLTSVYDGPASMGRDCVYTVLTDSESGYVPFGEKDELYCLISMTTMDSFDLVATLERTSENHAIDEVSVTPDDRFILVKETRGVYNDVLTVCDREGRWEGVRIDMGGYIIEDMQYRFYEETREGRFLFNLSSAGEGASSLIAECRIASGELLSCEMVQCGYVYDCLLSELGYVYIVEDTVVKAISTRNMCLPEELAGMNTAATIRGDNDLINNADGSSLNPAGDMASVPVGDLMITPHVARPHHTSPELSTGNDIGVGIQDSEGEALVEFFAVGSCHAYFNQQDGVFGLVDGLSPENSQVFHLYDFYRMMAILP